MSIDLSLGDVTFADNEIPEHIAVRTHQKSSVHKFVGGARQVDTLGADHDPIEWEGWLTGSNALDRALTLKGMCDAGLPLYLAWSEFFYQVTIDTFEADYERDYQIPYKVVCIVVQDMTNPPGQSGGSSIDDMMNGDMQTCSGLSSAVGDSGLTSSMSSLGSAISAVSSFATAAKSDINAVLTPLAQAQSYVKTMIASTENTLQSVTTLGGILPGNPIATSVAKLTGQINAMTNQTNLVQLSSVLGRMGTNLGQIGTGVKSINVGGGSLYDLASKYYGDITGWTALQTANPQLNNDPVITGNQTIVIPPYAGGSGGVLSA